MNKVKKIKFDSNGMAGDATLKRLFADVQMGDKDLFRKFAEVHEDVTGQECRWADFTKIFSKAQFIKSFIVSAEALKTRQEGVNGLVDRGHHHLGHGRVSQRPQAGGQNSADVEETVGQREG